MRLRGGDLGSSDRWIADILPDGWTEIEVERPDGTWVRGMMDPGTRLVCLVEMIEHLRGNNETTDSE